MPRPKTLRKVVKPPGFKGFKPYGTERPGSGKVKLLYEEYEAIKLADYDFLNHLEASKIMGVSRATFARIYESARRKMAKALVEVKEIKAVYGHTLLENGWFLCQDCNARFNMPENANKEACPVCGSKNLVSVMHED